MKKRRFKLCLQFFNEGFAAGGEAAGAEGSSTGFADLESQDEPEVVYGIQQDDDSEMDAAEETTEDQSNAEATDTSIDDYNAFKAKYKAEIGKEIQDAITRRFKNQNDVSGQLQALNDAVGPLYSKYGVEFGNVESLAKALSEDNSLIEELAEQSGMTAEGYRRYEQMSRETERLREMNAVHRHLPKRRPIMTAG